MHSVHNKKHKKSLKSIFFHVSKSFTLIEIMVVVSIIGFLSAVVVSPSLNNAKEETRDKRRISDINQIAKSIELFRAYNNYFPYPLNRFSPADGNYGTNIYADSRNPPNVGVPAYSNLMSLLVPQFLPSIPLPPRNNGGDGAMCGNCDEYRYMGKPFGTGYVLCTYLSKDPGGSGFNGDGYFYGLNGAWPFYCISSGCGAGTTINSCT